MAVVAVANEILGNDRVGIAHEGRTPPSCVKRAWIEVRQFLGGWFSHLESFKRLPLQLVPPSHLA